MKHKTKIRFLSLALVIVAVVMVACTPASQERGSASPEARAAYERYLKANGIETPEAKGFLYLTDTGSFAAADAQGEFQLFSTQREALRWLFDDSETLLDESYSYRLVGTEEPGLFCCIPGSSVTGKKVSIMGDSISTFEGVSNNTEDNPTIGENFVYYKQNRLRLEDTWWQQVIDTLRMELCVNNASSGTRVRTDRGELPNAAYKERSVQLHNAQGEEPDIIWIFMGTNDFNAENSNLGTVESLDYEKLIAAVDAGTIEPKTVCEAYVVMIYKIQKRYPNAQIYCMTLLPRRVPAASDEKNYTKYGQPTAFNSSLSTIAAYFGCKVVDLENCGIPKDGAQFDYYVDDQGLHPGRYGMDMISNAVMSAMLD